MSFKFLTPRAHDRKPNTLMDSLRSGLRRCWAAVRTPAAPCQLRVRETLQIGDKRQLMVVDVGDRQLLIGAAGNCLTMLAELDRHSQTEQAWKA